jgi:uncharacterized membrane protein
MFWPFYSRFYSVVEGLNVADAGSSLGQFLTVWGIFFGLIAIAALVRLAEAFRRGDDVSDGWLVGALALTAGGLAAGIGLFVGQGDPPTAEELVGLGLVALLVGLAGAGTHPTALRPKLLAMPLIVVVVAGVFSVWRPASAVALAVSAVALMFTVPLLRRPSLVLPWALCAIGASVVAVTEIVYVADDLQHSPWERMNTVFKFYLQAWMLLAIGSSLLLARVWRSARIRGVDWRLTPPVSGIVAQPGSELRRTEQSVLLKRGRTRHAVLAVAGLGLLATGLAYPIFGTPVRLDQDMPSSPSGLSLDGYAWMNGGQILNGNGEALDFTGDLAAIEWLNVNVRGNPVILEASIGPYRGNGSRISSATGLPTVLGWDRHQRQQRYGPGIDARMRDVRAIYNETDPGRKLEMLRRYRVEYVIVGDVERLWNTPENTEHYASSAGLAAFDALSSRGLFLVFESGTTRIYAVQDFPRIPPAIGSSHSP